MRPRDEQQVAEVEPQVERELAAVDQALAGRPVDPELESLVELARELRAKRPEPREEFAAELDARCGERFSSSDGGRASAARLRAWLGGLRPAQLLAPAGALATLTIVVSVAVVQTGGERSGTPEPEAPTIAAQEAQEPAGVNGDAADVAAPMTEDDESAATEDPASGRATSPGDSATALPVPPPLPPRDRLAPGQEQRRVERHASLELSADSDEFVDVADRVVEVSDRYRGIVVSSQQTATDEQSRATFELAIPSASLPAALADLSELANVESRSEGSLDITGPTVSAREQRDDAQAEVRSLRRQLADADSPAQTRRIRDRLDAAREELARARAQVRRLDRRARFANVFVTVTADASGDGEWGISEALDDARALLSTAAGVVLIAGAATLPIAILIAALWLIRRTTVRRGREQALGRDDPAQP